MATSTIQTKRTLLWTNPNPTSSMASQLLVNAGADTYSEIEVVYKVVNVYNGYLTAKAPFIAGGHISLFGITGQTGEATGAIYGSVRTINMEDGGKLRAAAAVGLLPSGNEANNNMCIPYKIYGIK